jgi:glutamate dehydrogenase
MRSTWSDIEALDAKINARTQYEMMFETTRLLRFCTYWLIHHHQDALNIDAQVRRLARALAQLSGQFPEALSGSDLSVFIQRRDRYRAAKVPEALSNRVASFIALRAAPDIVEISEQTRVLLPTVARVYFSLGAELSLDWIRERIESLSVDGHWQAVARTTLRDNIYELQRTLCLQVLAGAERKTGAAQSLTTWIEGNQRSLDHVKQTVNDMRTLPATDFATLSVALQAVRRVTETDVVRK